MSRVRLSLLAVLVVVLAAGCGGSSGVPDGAVAKVGDQEISKERLDGLMKQAKATYLRDHEPFPKEGSQAFVALRARGLAYAIVNAMYEEHARGEGIEVSDAEVAAELAALKRKQYGATPAKQAKAIKEAGISEEELEAQARLSAFQKKIEKDVLADVEVTDADVQKFYDTNKDRFTIPATRTIRQILVQKRSLAVRLRKLLLSGSDFAGLARRYSVDQPTAKLGGRVIISKGQTSPQFDTVAFSIATGKISEIITTQYGFQILQAVTPVRPPIVTPLARVKSAIKRQLTEEARQGAIAEWQLDAQSEFCDGDKIAYAKGFKPSAPDDPCRRDGATPASS